MPEKTFEPLTGGAASAAFLIDAGSRGKFRTFEVVKLSGDDPIYFLFTAATQEEPDDPDVPTVQGDDHGVVVGGVGAFAEEQIPDARYIKVRAISESDAVIYIRGIE